MFRLKDCLGLSRRELLNKKPVVEKVDIYDAFIYLQEWSEYLDLVDKDYLTSSYITCMYYYMKFLYGWTKYCDADSLFEYLIDQYLDKYDPKEYYAKRSELLKNINDSTETK